MSPSFDELVAAVTIGLNNKPILRTGLTGPAATHDAVLDPDPAAAALDAAALYAAAERGGVRAGASIALPTPAAADVEPELPGSAAEELRWAFTADPAVLREFLARTGDCRLRVPPALLPALLDTATRVDVIRPTLAAVLGERGRWLADLREDWAPLVSGRATAADEQVWEHGSSADRIAFLAALRRRDPAAARERLIAGWKQEPGDLRPTLLGTFRHGLSDDDEQFLETSLDDRKAEVRAVAAGLLDRLPGSAFVARAEARAAGLLSVERRALRRRLIVHTPTPLDQSALRDGMLTRPSYLKIGDGAWALIQLLGVVRPVYWQHSLGLSVDDIVGLPIEGEFVDEVRAGWRQAARRYQDLVWVQALLAARQVPPANASWFATDAELAQALPAADRERRLIALLGQGERAAAWAELDWCPAPWSPQLADAVVRDLVGFLSGSTKSSRAPQSLLGLIARSLPVDADQDWSVLARVRDNLTDPERLRQWRSALDQAIDILFHRSRFHRETRTNPGENR